MVDHKEFQRLGVQILGIAAETSFSQKTFAASLGLPYPLLSDSPGSRVARLYSAGWFLKAGTPLPMVPGRKRTIKEDRTVGEQAFFLIDKQGIIRGRWFPGNFEPFPSERMLKIARQIAKNS